jgi:hypothetical protein
LLQAVKSKVVVIGSKKKNMNRERDLDEKREAGGRTRGQGGRAVTVYEEEDTCVIYEEEDTCVI